MAIGRIAKGTASGTNSTGVGITLASALSISAGSTLVVMLRYDNTTAGTSVLPDGMAWNGHALAVPSGGGNGRGQTWLLQNATAGTGDLILDDSSAGILDSWEAIITEVTGCATESLDKGKSATGSG